DATMELALSAGTESLASQPARLVTVCKTGSWLIRAHAAATGTHPRFGGHEQDSLPAGASRYLLSRQLMTNWVRSRGRPFCSVACRWQLSTLSFSFARFAANS